jgi:glycosyltransferase involved in cell wall biosynthesis
MQYSVIIPLHNEAVYVERQLVGFVENLPQDAAAVLHEIILVENGSRDGTLDACRRLEKKYPSLVRTSVLARGSYGEAIKHGMLVSQGTHLSILECDALDSGFMARSIAVFRAGTAQVIVGSKRHPESQDRRPFKRRALTALYNLVLLRTFLGYPGNDTHGLKSIETECAKKLCEAALSTDEIFQTEIVLIAWRLGLNIYEIPVNIRELRSASVSVLRRVPKVIGTLRVLRKSLSRFPRVAEKAPLTSSVGAFKSQTTVVEVRKTLKRSTLPS